MNWTSLSNFVLPWWGKWVAIIALAVASFGYGYIKGIDHAKYSNYKSELKVIYKQGKVTERVVTKYIKVREKQAKINEEIKNEGQSYAIQFPTDAYHFNNEFVRVFDNSVKGSLSTLPSRESGADSGVTVPEVLTASVNNNEVAKKWKLRAFECEEWTQKQEELGK